jgi:signal transduction histidine kinase
MTVVNSFSEMLMENLGEEDPLYEQAQEIRQAGIRAADVAQHLIAFSRGQTMEFKLVDLNRLIDGDIKMLYRLIGEDI